MDALLRGSLTIRTSVSTDIFNDETYAVNQHKEVIDDDDKNYGSSAVTSTPSSAGRYKLATTPPR